MAAVVAGRGAIAGNGLFACRDIMPGDSILEDKAIVDVPKTETMADLHELLVSSGQYANFDSAEGHSIFCGDPAGRVVEEHRAWAEEVFDDAVGAAEGAERQRSLLAMRFNAHLDPSKTRQVLFPVVSKSNHSCLPNASVSIHEDRSVELVCLRPIAEGEEITISYLCEQQLCMPIDFRQNRFNLVWEFTCSCARCVCRHDDTRCFSCPREGCGGQCALVRDAYFDPAARVACRSCSICGAEPPDELLTSWYSLEDEVGRQVSSLPEGMYSAWCNCEEFVNAHPQHWLGSTWRRHLAAHNHSEAKDADTQEEAEELRAEALQALDAADRYVQTVLGDTLPALRAREELCRPASSASECG